MISTIGTREGSSVAAFEPSFVIGCYQDCYTRYRSYTRRCYRHSEPGKHVGRAPHIRLQPLKARRRSYSDLLINVENTPVGTCCVF
jgi:hypothetical protein